MGCQSRFVNFQNGLELSKPDFGCWRLFVAANFASVCCLHSVTEPNFWSRGCSRWHKSQINSPFRELSTDVPNWQRMHCLMQAVDSGVILPFMRSFPAVGSLLFVTRELSVPRP